MLETLRLKRIYRNMDEILQVDLPAHRKKLNIDSRLIDDNKVLESSKPAITTISLETLSN